MEFEVNNNKELIPLEHYLDQYKKADPEEISGRTGIAFQQEKGAFAVEYLHRHYDVFWPEFDVKLSEEDQGDAYAPLIETNQSKILVIRFLLEGAKAQSTGKFLTYRDVPWGEVYYRQFSGRCLSRLAFSYGNRLADYQKRMQHMGAAPIKESDAGYMYEIFPGFQVKFLIWAGDEEFPPSAQILFSDNFVAAFHPEDLVVVSEVAISTLKFM